VASQSINRLAADRRYVAILTDTGSFLGVNVRAGLDNQSMRSVSTGRLELSNSSQRLFSQRRRVARDRALADALHVRHTTVECCNRLTQATKRPRSIRIGGFLVGHRIPFEPAWRMTKV
jgi:hypothetical protein